MAKVLDSPKAIAEYLAQVLAAGDPDELLRAISYVVRSTAFAAFLAHHDDSSRLNETQIADDLPELDFSHAKRGALINEPGKERITIRIDAEVLAYFRQRVKGGGDYQALINDTLRASMDPDGG